MALLVGNNVVNVMIASIVAVLVASVLPPGPAAAGATVVTSLLVSLFGEMVPKSSGLGNAQRWGVAVGPVVALVDRALGPVIVVHDALTRRFTASLGGDATIERPYLD